MVIFDSVVLKVLEDCISDVKKGNFNYREWAVCKDIITINRKWTYAFTSHSPFVVELWRYSPEDGNLLSGENIASFRIKYIPNDMVAEMVSRIIEKMPRGS